MSAAASTPAVRPWTIRWTTLVAAVVALVLFVPIRRYDLPGWLPFDLEPYRALAAVVIAGWLVALIVDPSVRLRRTGLEAPIVLLVVVSLGSLLANRERFESFSAEALKRVALFGGFLLLLYLVVSVVRDRRDIEALCRLLVAGAAVVAAFALAESRTGFNVFDHVLPLPLERSGSSVREGAVRAFGSAQHPIALGAFLAMIVPLGLHFSLRAGRGRPLWWFATGLIALGTVTTISRTAVLMLAAELAVLLALKPRDGARALAAGCALTLAVVLVSPGILGPIARSFSPNSGLVAEQQALSGLHSSGRLADIRPSFEELEQRPILGQGLGTRVVEGERKNALLIDNQWLVTLLEIGVAGVAALAWFLGRFLRRTGTAARLDGSTSGSLLAALCAGVAGFAASMLTYDAFSFIQVTFVFFVLVGLGVSLLACTVRAR